jgi:hypothetical protein
MLEVIDSLLSVIQVRRVIRLALLVFYFLFLNFVVEYIYMLSKLVIVVLKIFVDVLLVFVLNLFEVLVSD